jgi:hypothetical protein
MKFLVIFFLLPLRLLAQDITGVWTGTLFNDTTKQYLKYELAVSEYNGKLSGYSHTIFVIDSIENIGVKSIKIKRSGDDYLVEDDKLIYNNYTAPPARGVRTFSDLELTETDSSMVLKGAWKTNSTRTFRSITGNIFLTKNKKIQETLIIPKLEELGVARSLSFIPYNNYSKNVATIARPVDNRPVTIRQNQNIDSNGSSKNNGLNSPGKKQLESKVQKLPTDTLQTTHVNNSGINTSDEIGRNGIEKNNYQANIQASTTTEKKEPEFKTTKVFDSTNLNFKYASDLKNQHDNKIATEASGINKKTDTTAHIKQIIIPKKEPLKDVDKRDSESVNISSTNEKGSLVQKGVTKISSINGGINNAEIRESEEQINPVKTLDKNYESFNSNLNLISKPAADISSRKIQTVQSVEIENDSLSLTLYDNGEIDGDTVSILLNGKVIMPMQGLTAKGISKTIYLTPEMGDSISLIMYAENLGSIPPNTGLLIVYDKNLRHEIRFSGDLQKNSAIILKRKKLH